jgi:hypothetical protein
MDRDHDHIDEGDSAVDGRAVNLPEPSDPARYRKVLAGGLVALGGFLLTRYGVDVDHELEKALVSLATLVTVYVVPNEQ